MAKRINMISGAAAQGGPGVGLLTSAGNPWTVSDDLANDLVLSRRLATFVDAQPAGLLPAVWDPNSTQLLAGQSPVSAIGRWRSLARPLFCTHGSSYANQDLPNGPNGDTTGVSPMFWINAIGCGFADLLNDAFNQNVTPTGGSQTLAQPFTNGVLGYSGGEVRNAIKYGHAQFISIMVQACAGRPFVQLMDPAVNDFNNNDIAGYDALVWADYLDMIKRITDNGGFALIRCNHVSSFINTRTKARNVAAFAERCKAYAAGRTDCAVIDIGATVKRFARGASLDFLTRGAVGSGDGVHPNVVQAIIHGIGGAEAIAPFFNLAPPWERSDFARTIVTSNSDLGTGGGTKGTNANASAVVPAGYTLNAYGTNTSALSSLTSYGGGVPGVLLDLTATTSAPVIDNVGFDQGSQSGVINTTDYFQQFVDMTVIQADYVGSIYARVRRDGSNFLSNPFLSANDNRGMSADVPNGPKLLEGRRIVLQTFPFKFPASSNGGSYNVGAGAGLDPAGGATGRLRTFTAFAGLIR